MAQEGLGRVFNVLPVADDAYVSLKGASAVSFVCVLAAGDTYTLTEATDGSGTGAQVLATITRFHVSATNGAVWQAAITQAAASTMVTTSDQDVAVLTVRGEELSDGFDYVKLASTSTGTVVAITHDLKVKRTPENLPAIGA